MEDILDAVQNSIHYRFRQVKLLQTALTHSSFANEQEAPVQNNERMEFLGDAVLELCVSEQLYRRFPDVREGELTRMRAHLVSKPALFEVAKDLGLERYLYLGKGEEVQGGRDRKSILSDAVEAILGAVFEDGGFEAARRWVDRIWEERWPEKSDMPKVKDYKSKLQELTQKLYRERPAYALEDSFGPEHAKVFTVRLSLPTGQSLTAVGKSVKKAEQEAARQALEMIGEKDDG